MNETNTDSSQQKDEIQELYERQIELENCLYQIIDEKNPEMMKALAADVLGEDLETLLEGDDLDELDFEDDDNLPWDDINANDDEA